MHTNGPNALTRERPETVSLYSASYVEADYCGKNEETLHYIKFLQGTSFLKMFKGI